LKEVMNEEFSKKQKEKKEKKEKANFLTF